MRRRRGLYGRKSEGRVGDPRAADREGPGNWCRHRFTYQERIGVRVSAGGRPLGGRSRYWPEERSDESFRRHGIVFANARVEDRYFLSVIAVVGSCVSPCADATTGTTRIARTGATWNYAGFSRLVAPVRTYSAWPVAGSAISAAAASSTCGTDVQTHGTDVSARLASIRSNADAG